MVLHCYIYSKREKLKSAKTPYRAKRTQDTASPWVIVTPERISTKQFFQNISTHLTELFGQEKGFTKRKEKKNCENECASSRAHIFLLLTGFEIWLSLRRREVVRNGPVYLHQLKNEKQVYYIVTRKDRTCPRKNAAFSPNSSHG